MFDSFRSLKRNLQLAHRSSKPRRTAHGRFGCCQRSLSIEQLETRELLNGSAFFFSQRDSRWASDAIYGSNGAYCGTIGSIGCAMTNVAMVMKSYGEATDPKQFNAWLNSNSGYDNNGNISWSKAASYTTGRVSYMPSLSWTSSNIATDNDRWSDLKAQLDQGYAVIVKVDANLSTAALEPHWVLVTAFNGGSISNPANYSINDPWNTTYVAGDTLNRYHDAVYDNTFFAMQVYHGSVARAPQPPTNVAATDGSYTDKVRVTWNASANAAGYEVWRNTSNNSATATKISTTDVVGTSFDDTTATAGTTYWYWVKAKNTGGTSGFSAADSGYRATTASGPANNNFASRTAISGTSVTVTGTNVGATKEAGEPNHAGNNGGKSVWWTWTAPSNGSVQIDTIGSNFDTILGVYTGSSVSSLTLVASNDDSGGNMTSKVTFNAVAGTSYQIVVDGYGGASGNITLHVCLTAGDQYELDNTPAQASLISIDGSVQTHSIAPANDVDWVRFTLSQASPVVIETRGVPGGDTRMWLFGPNTSTTQIAYDDDGGIGYYSRIVSAGLSAGTYFVKVDEYGNNNMISQYTISVTALQPADVFLTRSDTDLISTLIRTAESSELGVPYSTTYSHAAMYVGRGLVDEMVLSGYREVGLTTWFSEHEYVDIYRNTHVGNLGPLVAAVAQSYSETHYAPYQIEVLSVTALSPGVVGPIITSQAYLSYLLQDAGPQRMTCSELVARAFAEVGNVATLDVRLWPTLDLIGDLSEIFRWDFTTPTALSRSTDLRWLNT